MYGKVELNLSSISSSLGGFKKGKKSKVKQKSSRVVI
jgi:hypothetical protein